MISVWGLTDKGIVRRSNQDAYACGSLEEGKAWGVVCDGMGGANAGDVASALAVRTFQDHIERLQTGEVSLQEGAFLTQAVDDANRVVFRRAVEDPACEGMGTTLVGILVWDGEIWIANVGDSRAYLMRKRSLRRLTRDHSVVEDLVEQGKVTPEAARFHPQKNLITRALGTEPSVETDLFRETVQPGDILLLCSDGLVNVVTDAEIERELRSGGTPEEICRRLLQRTLRGGAPDNVTIVLFQLGKGV